MNWTDAGLVAVIMVVMQFLKLTWLGTEDSLQRKLLPLVVVALAFVLVLARQSLQGGINQTALGEGVTVAAAALAAYAVALGPAIDVYKRLTSG